MTVSISARLCGACSNLSPSEDRTNLYQHAKLNAQEAVAAAKAKAAEFDAQAAQERRANEAKSRGQSRSEGTDTPSGLVDRESILETI